MTEGTDAATATKRRPGRPRRHSPAERSALVLDAAVAAFAARGPAAVTVEAIAAAAGVNKAAVYEVFASKDALYAAAVGHERDRLVAFIHDRHRPEGGGRQAVRDRYHALLDFTAANPATVTLLSQPEAAATLDGSGRDALADTVAATLRHQLAAAGWPTGNLPDVLAAMFVGMAANVLRRSQDAGWDAEAVVDLLTDFTLAGLAGVGPDVLARVDHPAD